MAAQIDWFSEVTGEIPDVSSAASDEGTPTPSSDGRAGVPGPTLPERMPVTAKGEAPDEPLEGFSLAQSRELRSRAAALPPERFERWVIGRYGKKSPKTADAMALVPVLYPATATDESDASIESSAAISGSGEALSGSPAVEEPPQDNRRPDGTAKGSGWLGEMKRPDGNVSTELSIGVEMDGKETLIPLLVPTLAQDEVDYLLQNEPDPSAIPEPIIQKAVEHARERLAQGQSPFKDEPGTTAPVAGDAAATPAAMETAASAPVAPLATPAAQAPVSAEMVATEVAQGARRPQGTPAQVEAQARMEATGQQPVPQSDQSGSAQTMGASQPPAVEPMMPAARGLTSTAPSSFSDRIVRGLTKQSEMARGFAAERAAALALAGAPPAQGSVAASAGARPVAAQAAPVVQPQQTAAPAQAAPIDSVAAMEAAAPVDPAQTIIEATPANVAQAAPPLDEAIAQPGAVTEQTPAPEAPQGAKAEPVDWYNEMMRADAYYSGEGNTGGTADTPTGQPQVRKLLDAPESAGIVTSLRTGMIEDPDARIRALAKERFPKEENPERRYGRIDGEIVYRGDDGSFYREQDGIDRAASAVGEYAPALVGGTLGALVGPVGAGAGAVMGETVRKMGGLAQGDVQDPVENAVDLVAEGALGYVGAKAGDLIGKHIVDRRAVRDLPALNAAETQRLVTIAKQHGIDLTPAEATNLGSLIQQQTRLGMGFDEAGDTLKQFYGKRAGQVAKAVDDFIGATPGPLAAGEAARDAAGGMIDDAIKARSAAVKPVYDQLMRPDNTVPRQDLLKLLNDDQYLAKVFRQVRTDPLWRTSDGINISAMPENSLPVLDRAKKLLDGQIGEASRAGNRALSAQLQQRKAAITALADDSFPDYKAVRSVFEGASDDIAKLKDGVLGQIAKLDDKQLEKAARILINPRADAGRIAESRKAFIQAKKLKQWDDLSAQYLRDVWEGAATKGRTVKSESGARFREMVFGTPKAKANLRAALGQQKFDALSDLMDVLEATGRVPKGQSMTEPAMRAARREASEAAPVASASRNLSITNPMGELRDWWIETKLGKWHATLAKAITSPDAIKELEKLRVLKGMNPLSRARLRITTLALEKAGVLSGEAALTSRPTELPPPMPPQ